VRLRGKEQWQIGKETKGIRRKEVERIDISEILIQDDHDANSHPLQTVTPTTKKKPKD
jgi:hypothetical protein